MPRADAYICSDSQPPVLREGLLAAQSASSTHAVGASRPASPDAATPNTKTPVSAAAHHGNLEQVLELQSPPTPPRSQHEQLRNFQPLADWLTLQLTLPPEQATALSRSIERGNVDAGVLKELRDASPKLRRLAVCGLLSDWSTGDDDEEEATLQQQCQALHRALDSEIPDNCHQIAERQNAQTARVDTPQPESSRANADDGICGYQACISCCGVLLVGIAVIFSWFGVLSALRSQCQLNIVTSNVQKTVENLVGGAPIWARNTVLSIVLVRTIRASSGLSGGPSLAQQVLLGGRGSMSGGNHAAGWKAIVEDDQQSSWTEARIELEFTDRQALGLSVLKLFCWHGSQPISYLWIFWVFFCGLTQDQQALGAIVAVRELIYLTLTASATWCCPVFLLLDVGTVWNECESYLQR